MSENTRTHQLIGRISALVLFLLAVAYGVGGSMIEYAFSSDPLGPRFVPVMLAILLGLFTLIYLKFPGTAEGFPTGNALVRVLAVPVTLIVCVALMEPLGFLQGVGQCHVLIAFGQLHQLAKIFGEDIELLIRQRLDVDQAIAGSSGGGDDLVELQLHCLGVLVLGLLDQENHQEGRDRSAGIDRELPGIAETEQRPAHAPDRNHEHRRRERDRLPGEAGGRSGEARETQAVGESSHAAS